MTTKFHLAITADGHIVEGFLSAGNVSDITVADALYDNVFGCQVVEDKGYDSDAHRAFLVSQNNIPVIPGRKNPKTKIVYDKTIYRLRGRIKRSFGRLKEHKRLSMQYEKSDAVFLAFIALAAIKTLI